EVPSGVKSSMNEVYQEKDWVDTTSAFAPAILGAAAGVLIAEALSDGARRPVGLSLACIGLAALAPAIVETVVHKVNGPGTRRGSQRTLRGIRDGGLPPRDISYLDDELGEELGVG
ncbi:hypothetical protein N9879_00790, partial [bacterium]|nr:hypothetical protein [bacterium]